MPPSESLAELRRILGVVKKINSELNTRKLLALILETMISLSNARRGTIMLFKGPKTKAKLSLDRSGRALRPEEMGVSSTVLEKIREKGKPIVSADARNDGKIGSSESIIHLQLLSVLCLPLHLKDRLIGAVYLDNPGVAAAFGAREVELAEILTEHAALAIEKATLYRQSIRDRLTKAATHAYFEKRLSQEVARAKRQGQPVGLLMVDVDDFKSINDSCGHDTGNEVLKLVADTLAETCRIEDLVARKTASPLVARYGGDEFEVILPGTPREGTLRTGERLVAALGERKLAHNGKRIRLSISVGGAVFPDDAQTAHELQLRADEALYKSKRSGKNRALMCR